MTSRLRAGLATLASPPWRRAPFLSLRRPFVLLAVAGACAVTTAAASAVPLFVSSVGTAANEVQAEERCAPDTGATLHELATPEEVRRPGPDPFRMAGDRLGTSNRWAEMPGLSLADPAGRRTGVTVVARDEAVDHVEVVDAATGGGIWISDRAAAETGLGVGDSALVGEASVPVAAVYRDLAALTADDYWCSMGRHVLLEDRFGELVAPPALVLADRATFADIQRRNDLREVHAAWQAPLGVAVHADDADALITDLACHGDRSGGFEWCRAGQPLLANGVRARNDAEFVDGYFASSLPHLVARTAAIQLSVSSGVWPVAAFATLAGTGLVMAATMLWYDRRQRELGLLTVRGISPAGLGVKAVLELLPALVGGPVLGLALARVGVTWFGPSGVFEPSALRRAELTAIAVFLVSTAVVVGTVAFRVRSGGRVHRRRLLAWIPWELLLLVAGVVSYRRLEEFGVPVDLGASVTEVDEFGLLFPVLGMFTAIALVARLALVLARPVGAMARRLPAAAMLAVRRVVRARTATVGLLVAAAVAAGVSSYASTMERTMHATLELKADTFVGSDAAVWIRSDATIPATFDGRSTVVRFHSRAWVHSGDGRESASVLVVDPDSFAATAVWDPSFGSSSLADVLEALAPAPGTRAVPAVVLGATGATAVEVSGWDVERIPVVHLPGIEAFPGMRRAEATVVVSAAAVAGESGGVAELWVRGDRAATLEALRSGGIGFREIRSASEVADGAAFRTVTWTFGFLRSLGVIAAALVVAAVFVHLDARHRERLLAHAFVRRMGLSERRHRRALVIELGASVVVGAWTGLAVAQAAAWTAHRHMDPVPRYDPAPVLRLDSWVILGSAAIAVALVVVGAGLAQRRMERGDPVEVLRAGT